MCHRDTPPKKLPIKINTDRISQRSPRLISNVTAIMDIPVHMPDPKQNESNDLETRTIYCMHCGTAASEGDYACDRCGERVYVPDPARVPPLGFTSCMKCATVNEAHASYCAVCAAQIDQSTRISPEGTTSDRVTSNSRRGAGREMNQSAESRSGGYKIGGGTFRPSQWGLPRRKRSERSDGDHPPQEIQRWNWSAFILGPIWGLVHGIWWSILGFLPLLPLPPTWRSIGFIVLLGVMITLGIKGNELAWRARNWDNAEKFLAVQQRWATWSIVFAIGAFVAIILFLVGQG